MEHDIPSINPKKVQNSYKVMVSLELSTYADLQMKTMKLDELLHWYDVYVAIFHIEISSGLPQYHWVILEFSSLCVKDMMGELFI